MRLYILYIAVSVGFAAFLQVFVAMPSRYAWNCRGFFVAWREDRALQVMYNSFPSRATVANSECSGNSLRRWHRSKQKTKKSRW